MRQYIAYFEIEEIVVEYIFSTTVIIKEFVYKLQCVTLLIQFPFFSQLGDDTSEISSPHRLTMADLENINYFWTF